MNDESVSIYVPNRGWVRSYKDTPCGRGDILFTHDRERARSFPSAVEALEYWRQQSKTVPLRPDGLPNRPLTAFTVEIVRANEDPLMP